MSHRTIKSHLQLSFRHVQYPEFRHVQYPDRLAWRRRRGVTIARLDDMKGGDVVRGWFGVATCSRRDPFTKAIGRRLALERLLDAIPAHEREAQKLVIAQLDGYTDRVVSTTRVSVAGVACVEHKVDCQGNLITGP